VNRGFWFVAGAGAGIYAMAKARRAAETFTPEGIRDRMAGLGVGAHLFAEEVRTGMTEKEAELRDRLDWTVDLPGELESGGGGFETPRSSAPQPKGFETLAGARSSPTDLEGTD